jgi:hypothetical protein
MAEKTSEREVRIAGQLFLLRDTDVTRALCEVQPEPIASHFVVIGSRRYPPKQVISAITGLDRADFTTHQARRTLMRLGFPAGRRAGGTSASARRTPGGATVASAADERLANRLRPFMGQWVAVQDDDVIHASETPQQLVSWLSARGQKADSVFRVPDDELASTGLAPL